MLLTSEATKMAALRFRRSVEEAAEGGDVMLDEYLCTEELRQDYPELSDEHWWSMENMTCPEQRCIVSSWLQPLPEESGPYCPPYWDTFKCWPATPANTTVEMDCPPGFIPNVSSVPEFTPAKAHRTCNASGQWEDGPWTNYNACVLQIAREIMMEKERQQQVNEFEEQIRSAVLLRDIYFFGCIISAIMLIITFAIFTYFKSLKCNRISIHKNLVMSFIIRSITHVIIFEPFVTGREFSYRDVDVVCKLMVSLVQYSIVANIFWMLVEGMFLHNRVAVSVFNREAPFRFFYFVGWGMPVIVVGIWATCMYFFNTKSCWNDFRELPYNWIVVVPILAAILVNAIFLVNIIRILVTKLQAQNSETDKVRKAVKATAVLFPLLGLTNILFIFSPDAVEGNRSMIAYRITNAVLQSSQGIFVSFIYCFVNAEVHSAIRKVWQRHKARRMSRQRGRRPASSRASSSLYLSSSDIDTYRYKRRFVKSPTGPKPHAMTSSSGSSVMGGRGCHLTTPPRCPCERYLISSHIASSPAKEHQTWMSATKV